MAGHRIDRISEDVKRELADILRELKDPRITGLLSVVRVELAGDLSSCKVYVSSMEGKEACLSAVKGLKSASGYIRHELSVRLKIRHTPELRFIADDSIEHSADIAKLIHRALGDEKE